MECTPGPNILAHTLMAAPAVGLPDDVRKNLAEAFELLTNTPGYSHELAKKLEVVELAYRRSEDQPSKMEARAVCEITVDESMVNDQKILHGGFSAFLVDFCGSIVITLWRICDRNPEWKWHVSKTIDVVYHSAAKVGTRLRIVNSTMSMGKRSMTSRTEIFSKDGVKSQLLVSGTHVKMDYSAKL